MVLKLYTQEGVSCCPNDPRYDTPMCPENDIFDVCQCYCAGTLDPNWLPWRTYWLNFEAVGTIYSNFGIGANPCAGGGNVADNYLVENETLDIEARSISTVPTDCYACEYGFPGDGDCDYIVGESSGYYDCVGCDYPSPFLDVSGGGCTQLCPWWDPDSSPYGGNPYGYEQGIVDLDVSTPDCADEFGYWSVSCPEFSGLAIPNYEWAVSIDISSNSPYFNCCDRGCFSSEWTLESDTTCPDCTLVADLIPQIFYECCPVELGNTDNGQVFMEEKWQTITLVDQLPDCFFTETKLSESQWEFSPLYCCYNYNFKVDITSVVIAPDAPEACDPGSNACTEFTEKDFPLEIYWYSGPGEGVIPYCISELTCSWNNGGKKDVSVVRDVSLDVDNCESSITVPSFGNVDYICADPYVNFSFTTDADADVPGCDEYDGDIYIEKISGTGRFRDLQKDPGTGEWTFRWTGSSCDPTEPVEGRIVHHRQCNEREILCELLFSFTPDGPTCGLKAPDAGAVVDLSLADYNHIIANAPAGESPYLILEAIVPCENCNDACESIGVAITGSGETIVLMDIKTTAGELFWYCTDCIQTFGGSGCDSGPSGVLGQECDTPGTLDVTAGTSTFFRAYVGYLDPADMACMDGKILCPGLCATPVTGLPGGSTIEVEFNLDPAGCQDCDGAACA